MADMVEEAVGPDDKTGAACDRAFVTPETGSDLALGQTLRFCFFLDVDDDDDDEKGSSPLLCTLLALYDEAEMVDMDEDESVR